VCGLGKVGYQVVRALHRMEPRPNIVVIYDKGTTPRFIAETEALGIETMQGDARTEEMLYAAGIERAYSVVAVTSDNLSNLRIGLIARQIRSDIHLVLRVFSDVLADQLDDIFGIHTTFSSSALAAPTLAAAAVVKHTSYAIDIGNRLISSVRLTVHEGDEFAGRTAQAVREEYGMVVVTVRRAGQTTLLPWSLNKPACMFDGPLYAGDDIVVMADVQTIGRLHNRGAQSAIIDPGITGAPTPSARTLALRTTSANQPEPDTPASASLDTKE
jgi:Trk K+ transport system NAD-binding subunit